MWVSVLARAPKNARKRAVHPNHYSLLCTHRYSGLDRIGTLFALRADDQPFTAHRNVIWDSRFTRMSYVEFTRSSPHFDVTPANERLGVLFHHSVMSFEDTLDLMCGTDREVSYHALIARDGRRCTLVADEHRAWHAGESTFLDRPRCNDFLLGLAFAGDTYAEPLSAAQVESALEWLEKRWQPYGWTTERMIDHRQVSPGRKDDLNPVEWERLRAAIEKRFKP